jgi:acetate---CoA ligase (ADP-forming)
MRVIGQVPNKFATNTDLVYNTIMSLKNIFEPKSIAIIGASDKVGSVGYTIFQNLINSKAKIFPVNPKHDTVGNQKSYKSILEIDESVDLGIIIVPAKFCVVVLNEIANTNCKSVILISAGFKEVGLEGLDLESQLVDICRTNNITLVGPNCLGVINPVQNLNMSFSASMPPMGNIALVSQSGAICTAIIDSAEHLGVGFSKFVSTGNKSVVDEAELIEFLNDDKETKLIAIYTEGLHNAARFISACQKSTKPIIVLKSGKSDAGAKSASSHTGALASDNNLYKALFRQAGVIEIGSIEELFEVMQVLSHNELSLVKNIAIVTNAGGPGVLATDAAIFNNLELAKLTSETETALRLVLPTAANFHNPIDLIGDATSVRYRDSLDIITQDKAIDAILIILTPQAMTDVENIGEIILQTKKKYHKPIVVSLIGYKKTHQTLNFLRQNGVSVIDFPENAVRALSKINKFSNNSILTQFETRSEISSQSKDKVKKVLESGKSKKFIPENEAKAVLDAYQIPTVKSFLARSEGEAVDFASILGSNVVLKIVSQDIFHKTDLGGILLDLETVNVGPGYNQIMDNIQKNAPDAKIDGILVSEYINFSVQNQFVLGVKKDSNLGHSIMFGLGGIFVEVFRDSTFGFLPLSELEIDKMIDQLVCKQFLFGTRGLPSLDIAELKKTILNLAQLVIDFPEIVEMDMNPIVVLERGVKVLDCKIVVE